MSDDMQKLVAEYQRALSLAATAKESLDRAHAALEAARRQETDCISDLITANNAVQKAIVALLGHAGSVDALRAFAKSE